MDRRLVVATAYCGILACFGLDILANFQETHVIAAHMVGAMTCFSAGTIYFCLQVHRNTNLYVLSQIPCRETFIYRQCCNHSSATLSMRAYSVTLNANISLSLNVVIFRNYCVMCHPDTACITHVS